MVRASELALLGVGLTMTFDLLGFANFYHTELAALAAYMALTLSLYFNFPLAILLSVVFIGFIAVGLDKLILKRLRGSDTAILMIMSLGISLIIRNIVRTSWGAGTRDFGIGMYESIRIFGAYITRTQIVVIAAAILFMIIFHILLHRTRLGKAMRATSDDPSLAEARGIDTEFIISAVWFVGAAMAGVGGIMLGMETQLQPNMGFDIVIPVFCAVILGGLGNPYGAMLGALTLALVENFFIYFNFANLIELGNFLEVSGRLQIPTEYKVGISFVVLIIVLFFKPSGILGST